ncbi:MAG: hypothetical protein A2V88_13285 [Elusimicrobia bacterium RBG_16_66_12]|nr:MAG: hypothetical protein A2V88_13285 [Elusimicrobia bacterium RBG_16_66_12]
MTARRRSAFAAILLGLGFGLTAVAASAKKPAKKDVPEQLRWSQDWGPMVPHKKFPRDCGLCHLPKSWDALRPDFRYDHKRETGYALTGAHARASCLRCHNDRGPVASFKARGCAGCHVDPHKSAMGMDCQRCHGEESWQSRGTQGDRMADHARTRFPLIGVHSALPCDQCHTRTAAGDFRGLSPDCFRCHLDSFSRAPNHVASNFPRDCRPCHGAVAWAGAVMNHSAFSASVNCASCHLAQFQAAPNHVANNYPQTCANCHQTSTWLGAIFAHPASATNCVSCHLAKYQSAPNHVASGYPQTCGACHSQTSWLGANFNHSFLGGNLICSNCHHDDFVAAAAPVNHTAQGIIESACSQCHSSNGGVWQPASFTHNPAKCYDSGSYRSHENATCVQCHPSSYSAATCTACHQNRSDCD